MPYLWQQIAHRFCCRLTTCRPVSTNSSVPNQQSLVRITLPHKLAKNFEKNKIRKLVKKLDQQRLKGKSTGPLLISCKRKAYNFYMGQKFDEFNVASMVSCGWKNKKRVGDYFTLMPYSENPSFQDHEDEPYTFNDLGLNQDLCLGLNELGYDTPTEIQKRVIPSLLEGNNVVCAAETGSGKTLAYLLPSIEWVLRKQQSQQQHGQPFDNINSPNTIILTPNRELCKQVMCVAESLKSYADFTPFCIIGGENITDSYRHTKKLPMDILVSSPGKLRNLLNKNVIKGKNLQHVVVDESDTLLDDSFVDETRAIFNHLKVVSAEQVPHSSEYSLVGTQIVLTSATMPRDIKTALDTIVHIEEMEKITTEGLHHIMPHVPQRFLRINPDSKNEKLVQLLKRDMDRKEVRPTLVFVKNNKTCHFVEKMLTETGLHCLKLHGGIPREQRDGVLNKFLDGYCDILVATDIASRGLDTINVSHVINFDCPQFMSDYIHRVGRVGRVGMRHTEMKVTTLVSQKWEVDLVWKIEVCARRMKPLSDVDANIKRELDALKRHKDHLELNML